MIKIEGDSKILVSLRPGDVGKCSTDAKPRNNAKIWERAEIKQVGHLKSGGSSEIQFEFQILQGFSGSREGFFQIHAHDKDCWAYPPLMLGFDRGQLVIRTLRNVNQTSENVVSKGSHKSFKISGYSAAAFRGAPKTFLIRYDAHPSSGTVSVAIDGSEVLKSQRIEIAACGKPHVEFGIYRPGPGTGVSTAVFDEFNLAK